MKKGVHITVDSFFVLIGMQSLRTNNLKQSINLLTLQRYGVSRYSETLFDETLNNKKF